MTVRKRNGRLLYVCRGYVEGYANSRTPCRNGVPLSLKAADRVILTAIEEQVLTPQVVMATLKRAITRLSKSVNHAERATLAANLRQVEVELQRLTAAVVGGANVPSIIGALQAAEDRKARISEQLDALDRAASLRQLNIKTLEPELTKRLQQWSNLLGRHPLQARQILRKLLPIRITVVPEFKTRRYIFSGYAHLPQLIEGLIPDAETDLRVSYSQRNWRGSTAWPRTWIS